MNNVSLRAHISGSGLIAVIVLVLAAGCAPPEPEAVGEPEADVAETQFDTAEYRIRLVTVADGLAYPYSMVFLPGGNMLFTEMGGQLRMIRDGVLQEEPIPGIPEVFHTGASKGLMDIALHPNFAENNLVYFTYDKEGEDGVTEALARGVFNGSELTGVEDVFIADAWATTNGRQNSRITFAPDGTIFMSASSGGRPNLGRGQVLDNHAGKILRIRDDGSVPDDNPFVGRAGTQPEIFTYGHQNIHAMAPHPETGDIWSIEHGDEANILRAGANYGVGLPADEPLTAGVEVMEPHISWIEPDIHPSGMLFYTGDAFPAWQGSLFLGGLNTNQIHRVRFDEAGNAEFRENLFSGIGQWVRDLRQGPDGFIYFTSYDDPDAPGMIRRIEPAE